MARVSLAFKWRIPALLFFAAAGTAVLALNTETLIRSSSDVPLAVTALDFSMLESSGKSVDLRALTDSAGKMQFNYVPTNEWNAGTAVSGNRLTLPMDALGSVRIRGLETSPVETFAVHRGNFVAPSKYALNLVSPFSLLCRSDEGPPARLAEGERYSYEVSEPNLKQVLNQNFIYDPHYYKLPDNLGYSVSSAGGPSPKETWAGLERLSRMDRISRLEIDPCWKFLPEAGAGAACEPGVREFPEKAVRLSGNFGGMLKDPYAQLGVTDAHILYSPISPTPYYNPGYRFGDERPPTYVRSGSNGGYRAMLDGLSGPIEIGVAKGCYEHSTVAIAEGSGTQTTTVAGLNTQPRISTPATTPATTPPPKPIATAPKEKPKPDQLVCGPDVTNQFLGALQLLQDTYKNWDSAERSRRCNVLFHPLKFNAAWDMQLFTPSDAGEPEGKEGYMEYQFFQRAAPGYCAVPRYPCGPTVQFMGYCVNAQVVNYVQWGLMNQLCGTDEAGDAAVLVRSGFSTNFPGQDTMRKLGGAFGRMEAASLSYKKDIMKRLMDRYVRDNERDWYKMDGTGCAMGCGAIAPQAKQWLDNQSWGFQWDGSTEPITQRGFQLKKP